MTTPKRHHYNAEHLLKRFTDDRGRLHFFDRRAGDLKVRSSAPRELFFEKHLYSTEEHDGSKDFSVEHFFAGLEGQIDGLIEHIVSRVRQAKRVSLTLEQRGLLDAYVHYQWKRVPAAIRANRDRVNADEVVDKSLANFEQNHGELPDTTKEYFVEPRNRDRIIRNAQIKALQKPAPLVLAALSQKPLIFATPLRPDKKCFVITSSPVIRMSASNINYLPHPDVELWLPIASDVMLGYGGNHNVELQIQLTGDLVRYMNVKMANRAELIAARSSLLLESIAAIHTARKSR